MKKLFVTLFFLGSLTLASMPASAQGRGHGGGGFGGGVGGPGFGGANSNGGLNPGNTGREHGSPADVHSGTSQHQEHSQTQQPLKDSQINGGAFKMLEQKTGMTQSQLEGLYQTSGAKNFGQFTSAVVVSKNLGLDTNAVLSGLKTQSLGETLKGLGVAPDKAKTEIKRAQTEVKQAS